MDLFDKCHSFTRADEVRSIGYYPYFYPIYENDGPVVFMNGQRTIMAGSNNYLGLTTDPRVKEAAIAAVRKYGSGCSGSRLLNGTLDIHVELEEALADFVGKEAALLFSTGFQTNQGTIVPMIGDGDYIVSDSENHASIIQGTIIAKSRSGAGGLVKYEHNDMADLEKKISALPLNSGKLLVTDGVFSMSGEIVNLPELVRIAKKYNARVMVDDAHGLGVIGKGGRGTASHFGLDDQVDLIMGTFSKSLASLGGFVAADRKVIDYIKHHSPAFIFSASMTPAQVAAARASLEIIKNEPELVWRVHDNANRVRKRLKELGLRVIDAETPIVSIITGDDMLTFMFWRKLFDGGVFNNPIVFPATPHGMQLIRMSFMATHEDWQLDFVIEQCEKIAREIGLLKAA
ncbi:MAG TPA: aminotransferase class I/II-fold pyridoxal phosphate-dependent enzyme [Spirochaetota bacterium]|nr:aminotransferase class I/II-fold pyridoxal phosphate-dependent enzyme [Spirochaetota bacterium]